MAVALVVGGCECSSKPPQTDGGVIEGETPPEVAATVELGPAGGIVAIVDPDSPLFGANLVLPPLALARLTEITLAAAEDVPERSNAIGVGSVLEIQPADLAFGRAGTAELPVPDGADSGDLTVARWNETRSEWEIVPSSVSSWEDPDELRGGLLRFQTDGGGSFRAIYREPQPVSVLNDGSGPLEVTLGAARFTRVTPSPPGNGELLAAIEARDEEPFLLLPGEYILHGTFEGEVVPRCTRVTITDPITTVPVETSFSDFTPPCAAPAVRVTLTPNELAAGEVSALHATATAATGTTVTWHWQYTGGAVFGELMGEAMSGEMITTMWTAPNGPGTYHVALVAENEEGWFASANARVTVTTRNQRPVVTQLTATPEIVGPGFPGDARQVAETSDPGVTRFRAVVSDLDGDDVAVFWTHREPGNWYDASSGGRLSIDEDSALVVSADTGRPYTEAQILYMAPSRDYVESLRRGWWMPAAVTASDGELRDRAFRMITVAQQAAPTMDGGPEPDGSFDAGRRDAGRDAGTDAGPEVPPVAGRCVSVIDSECEMYVGDAYRADTASLEASCTSMSRTWTEGFACPESGSIGACYRFPGEPREVATVYYGGAPTTMELMALTNDCRNLPVAEGGPGTWVRPYRAPR